MGSVGVGKYAAMWGAATGLLYVKKLLLDYYGECRGR